MTNYVIIDGNNLEKLIYGQDSQSPVTVEIDRRFISALWLWAYDQPTADCIELCLDPRRDKIEGEDWVKVFIAEPGMKGDDIILQRVRTHVYNQEPCFVVTNDRALIEEVRLYKVMCLTSYYFINNPDPNNLTFVPFPEDIPLGKFPPSSSITDQTLVIPHKTNINSRKKKFDKVEAEITLLEAQQHTLAFLEETKKIIDETEPSDLPIPESCIEISSEKSEDSSISQDFSALQCATQKVTVEKAAKMSFEIWPLDKGEKFLIQSFCEEHLRSFNNMLTRPEHITVEYISTLAEVLLETCGGENNFVRRGGCLMDRVRLALLQAQEMRLTIRELVALTGDNQSKILEKLHHLHGVWVKVEEIQSR